MLGDYNICKKCGVIIDAIEVLCENCYADQYVKDREMEKEYEIMCTDSVI